MEGGFATTWGASHGQGKDIRDARSDTRVLNSGPTQAQPIRGVPQHLTIGVTISLFVLVLGVHVSYILTLPQEGHIVGTGQRSSSSANVPFFFLTASSRVGFRSSHVNTHTCLGWNNVCVCVYIYIYTHTLLFKGLPLFGMNIFFCSKIPLQPTFKQEQNLAKILL